MAWEMWDGNAGTEHFGSVGISDSKVKNDCCSLINEMRHFIEVTYFGLVKMCDTVRCLQLLLLCKVIPNNEVLLALKRLADKLHWQINNSNFRKQVF